MKGSPAEVLERCDRLRDSGKIHAVEAQRREWIEAQNFRMSGAGLRVLGVAYRWAAPGAAHRHGSDGWVWSGLVGLKDPVRRNARTVVQALHRAGIRTVVITGDQGLTAHRIGEELGLAGAEPLRILDATDLRALNGKGLGGVVTRTHVFARLSPTQKQQVIQAYQNAGLSVAMVGDGFNDVLALKVADVGIAMGRRGAELARRTADLVLEDDDLEGLLRAVATGRAFYGNIRRSLAYVLACSHMDLAAELVSHTGRVAGASPLQSVWSSLASLSLALDPAEPGRLDRPPEHEGAVLLAEADTRRAVGDALRATAAAAVAGGMEVAGPCAGAFGRSVAVNQMLYALACRADGETPRPPNRVLEALSWLVCGGYAAATLATGGAAGLGSGLALAAGAWLSHRFTGRDRFGGPAQRGAEEGV
jgi:Ca2+-transporting ATPase